MSQVKEASDREIVVSRVLEATRERVWEALTDPKQLDQWWGPDGFKNLTREASIKPGGVWRHVMVGPDGVEYPNVTKFEEVVKPERIVYANGGRRKDGPSASFRAIWTLKPLGRKTELTIRLVFTSASERDRVAREFGAVEGGRQTLGRLAGWLEGEFRISRLVNAPRERVWRAWTDPDELKAWFGPKGTETFSCKVDFEVGGVNLTGMKAPGGHEMWGKWTFREIEPPGRLVYVQSFSDKNGGETRHPMSPTWPLRMLTTVLFQDFGGKTLITLKWAPLDATEVERKTFEDGRAGMTGGWTGTFERLDEFLSGQPAFELVLTRVIDAPRERVFKAWSKPEEVSRWFAPQPLNLPKCEMDFRPGGRFKMAMAEPGGREYPFSGTYREIVPPERLVWTGEFPYGPVDQMRTVVTFEAQGEKTKLTVRQTFSVLTPETEPHAKGSKQGWTATLNQLAAHCER